jgi:predicted transposase YbfD/YdcC
MPATHPASILTHFASLDDPRRQRGCLHNLLDMVVVAICAVICGCDDWVEVAAYGRKKLGWLKTFLPLPNGIPSHDTFCRVFARLDPAQFQRCFLAWVEAARAATAGRLVAIDGKTLRRSFDAAAGKGALHLISAWSGANHLVLGQRAVGDSNEVTAIPELVRLLDLTGAVVTLDALGCQREVVEAVRDQGADYVITLKGNQESLYHDVATFFIDALGADFAGVPHRAHHTRGRGHGRHEGRHYYIAPVPEELRQRHGWRDLQSIGMVYSERQVGEEEATGETRFFISSLPPAVKEFARAVRGHWGIENSLHWVLDVVFAEDRSRVRKGHGQENFALLRRTALSLLKGETTTAASVKCKRKMAGWDDDLLLRILLGSSQD